MSYFVASWETHDKQLKTIRRAIEEATRGTLLSEWAADHGYTLPEHWTLDNVPQEPEEPQITVTTRPLPAIHLHHFHRPGPHDQPAIKGITCAQCGATNIHIGSTSNAYSANHIYRCEECAITNYQKEYSFPNHEAAAARRRRMFDVGYLLREMLIDWYIYEHEVRDMDSIDQQMFDALCQASTDAYNLLPKERKIALEETEQQHNIEKELRSLLPTAIMFAKKGGEKRDVPLE